MLALWPGLEREEPNLTYEQCTRATGYTFTGLITASRLKGKTHSCIFKFDSFHMKMKLWLFGTVTFAKNIFQA
jgi:hypothetical protein